MLQEDLRPLGEEQFKKKDELQLYGRAGIPPNDNFKKPTNMTKDRNKWVGNSLLARREIRNKSYFNTSMHIMTILVFILYVMYMKIEKRQFLYF